MPPKGKKPDYSSAQVNKDTVDSIKHAFSTVESDTTKDKLFPDKALSLHYTKVLMIQQAVTESLRKGATILARTKVSNV